MMVVAGGVPDTPIDLTSDTESNVDDSQATLPASLHLQSSALPQHEIVTRPKVICSTDADSEDVSL